MRKDLRVRNDLANNTTSISLSGFEFANTPMSNLYSVMFYNQDFESAMRLEKYLVDSSDTPKQN